MAAEEGAFHEFDEKVEDLKDLLTGDHAFTLSINMDGRGVVDFQVKRRVMSFDVQRDGNGCIELKFLPDFILLDDYYDVVNKEICRGLPHDYFFDIIDFLSSILRQPIKLMDESHKKIGACDLDFKILTMVSKQTFYNRFKFYHHPFNAALEQIAGEAIPVEVKEHIAALQEPELRLDEAVTVEDLARSIVENCRTGRSSEQFETVIGGLTRWLKLRVKELLGRAPYFFTRAMSSKKYEFELVEGGGKFELHITSPRSSGGRKRRSRKCRRIQRRTRGLFYRL